MSFRFPTAADFQDAYRKETTDPLLVAERALQAARRLDHMEPAMRTFIALDEADVRRQAEASAKRWRAREPLSPLDGVPVAVKDEYDVVGYPTTCGTKFLGKTPATVDALAVARLRGAGAIIFGKTNMHELGMQPSGVNPWHGTARNPYDPARDTGGSSSGSGACVGMGLTPIALGNDGGGSIRVPASHNGVVGIKGTFGRVPTEGVPLLCWSLEHSGPLGGSVADVVTAFGVITGEALALPELPKTLRIGMCDRWWGWADGEVAAIARAAVERIVGGQLVDIELPHIELSLPVGAATFTVEGAAAMDAAIEAGEPMSPSTRIAFEMARGMGAVAYVKAQRARALIVRDFERAWDDVDVIVTPTTAITAPPYPDDAHAHGELDENKINKSVTFTFASNLTGMPAASVPCGYDAHGMPVGLQVIAPWGEDLRALAVAAAVEHVTHRHKPKIWCSPL
ncbi:MAG: Amidase [Myxococcales bacterium]|nr:Amidase [Myxococcales bacterium]